MKIKHLKPGSKFTVDFTEKSAYNPPIIYTLVSHQFLYSSATFYGMDENFQLTMFNPEQEVVWQIEREAEDVR